MFTMFQVLNEVSSEEIVSGIDVKTSREYIFYIPSSANGIKAVIRSIATRISAILTRDEKQLMRSVMKLIKASLHEVIQLRNKISGSGVQQKVVSIKKVRELKPELMKVVEQVLGLTADNILPQPTLG